MVDATVPTSAAPRRLQAFLAALSELEEAERVRLLRAYLEYTLDVTQANEEEYFTFLGECASLAADNMQDIRLKHLELQVGALASPPPKQWGEVLTDVVVGLMVQVGILALWEGAAVGIIALAGSRTLAAATKTARAELIAARSERAEVTSALVGLQAQKQNLLLMNRGGYVIGRARGGWRVMPNPIRRGEFDGFTVPAGAFDPIPSSSQLAVNPKYLRDQYDAVTAQISIAQSATTTNSVRISKALATYKTALADGNAASKKLTDGWGTWWRDNIGNEKGGVVTSTSKDIFDGIDGALDSGADAGPGDASTSEPFTTSEITGRYLNWVREERLDVVESYANLRLLLRSMSDADLLQGDALLMHIGLLGTEVLQRWQELRVRPHAARAAIVKGMEAAFWREYLLAAGILDVNPIGEYSVRDTTLRVGQVVGGHLILGVMPDDGSTHFQTNIPGNTRYRTWHYTGSPRLPEDLAGMLFYRFAQPYFANSRNAAALKPFEYAVADYADVSIPPKDDFWGSPDPVALRRIDEMRFMVINFFNSFATDAVDPAALAPFASLRFMSAVAGSEAGQERDAWLAAQVHGVDTSTTDPAVASAAGTLAAEAQFTKLAQLSASTPGNPVALELAQLQLNDVVTDLNQDIQAYQLLKSGVLEVEGSVDKREPDDLEMEIDAEKLMLQQRYDTLLDLAGDDDQTRKDMIDIYQPAVDALKNWQPGRDWVWYGPDRVPETSP